MNFVKSLLSLPMNIVRFLKDPMEMMWKMGLGRTPRTDVNNIWEDGKGIDFHCWLEDDVGNIIDPTPPAYQGKRHYKAFSKKEQLRLYLKAKKTNYLVAKQQQVENPLPRKCINNSYSYKMLVDKKLKFVIGHMGFELNDGRIFWEFG